MWWVGSKPYDVYLGSRAFAVCKGADRVVVCPVGDVNEAVAAFTSWLAEAASPLKLRLWLSGGLCRAFLVQAVPGVSGEEEWHRVAAAMAPAQCGLVGPCRVWLSPSSKSTESRVAVAVEESLLERLQAVVKAASQKHRMVSIRPWWSEALRQALLREPALPVLAVHDCDALTVLAGEGGRFDSAATLSPVLDAETAASALARMLMASDGAPGREMQARLHLESSGVPDARSPLAALTEWSR